jgi:hypothetical protein
MATSNVGRWDRIYSLPGTEDPAPYADTATYRMGAEWLARCPLIEDWGCGKGWLRTLVAPDRYRGIDGSRTPHADVVADLADYRSQVPGVFMRHVLEHDFRWKRILDNALDSFSDRMALILFTPFGDETRDIEWEDPPGVPNLSFRLDDLAERIDVTGASWDLETVESAAKYKVEHVFRIAR